MDNVYVSENVFKFVSKDDLDLFIKNSIDVSNNFCLYDSKHILISFYHDNKLFIDLKEVNNGYTFKNYL